MTISAGVRCCPCSGLGFLFSKHGGMWDELSQTRGISRELFWSASTPAIRSLNKNHTGWGRRRELFVK